MGGTFLHALRDHAAAVFDGQEVDDLLLLRPRHLPGNLLVATHHVGLPLLGAVHRLAGGARPTEQT